MAPKVKTAQPAEKSADQVTIDRAEFIRTRDALVTSWMQLNGAIEGAIKAYITHSNNVLEGKEALNHESLNVLNNVSQQVAQTGAIIKAEDEVKQKKKRIAKPKDPNAPKRPLTAYLLYLEEMRPTIQQDLGEGQKRGDISSEGTRRWHTLTPEQQQVYKDRYQSAYARYQADMKEYLANNGAEEADVEAAETPAAADESSVVSDDSEDDEPVKEPTPPPPPSKTPKSKSKKAKAEAEAPASSPIKSSKKTKAPQASAAVETAKEEPSPALKRKSEAKADVPKAKKTKKETAAPASKADAEETPKKEKRERKKRKSEAAA